MMCSDDDSLDSPSHKRSNAVSPEVRLAAEGEVAKEAGAVAAVA